MLKERIRSNRVWRLPFWPDSELGLRLIRSIPSRAFRVWFGTDVEPRKATDKFDYNSKAAPSGYIDCRTSFTMAPYLLAWTFYMLAITRRAGNRGIFPLERIIRIALTPPLKDELIKTSHGLVASET